MKANNVAFQKMLVAHYIENVPEDCKKNIVYVIQGDGIWEIRKNVLGTFTTRICKEKIPGLVSNMKEGWELNVPLIPVKLLNSALSFFKEVYKIHKTEAHLQFYYDTETEEYILHCPKQTVGPASVRYENDSEFNNCILVLEMHSHASMSAFFSSTDNEDEKSDRFFGVVGKVCNYNTEMKFRLSVGGRKIDVDESDIFDIDLNDKDFPEEWIDNVKKEEPKVTKIKEDSQLFLLPPDDLENIDRFFDDDHLFSKHDKYDDFWQKYFPENPSFRKGKV